MRGAREAGPDLEKPSGGRELLRWIGACYARERGGAG